MQLELDDIGSRASLALIKASNASGSIDEDRVKFQNLALENGITFDANGDIQANELYDKAEIAMEVLGVSTNTVNHRLVLDESILNNKLNAIANLFGVTFNGDGTINTESYNGHTHEYADATINDTADGSGTQTNTTRETQGVS